MVGIYELGATPNGSPTAVDAKLSFGSRDDKRIRVSGVGHGDHSRIHVTDTD